MSFEEIREECDYLLALIEVTSDNLVEIMLRDPLEEFLAEKHYGIPGEYDRGMAEAEAEVLVHVRNLPDLIEEDCMEILTLNTRFRELTEVLVRVGEVRFSKDNY